MEVSGLVDKGGLMDEGDEGVVGTKGGGEGASGIFSSWMSLVMDETWKMEARM